MPKTNTYYCDDGQGIDTEIDATSPSEAAENYVAGGFYTNDDATTWWVHVTVRKNEADRGERFKVARHPTEPPCSRKKHKWTDSTVWGSGGGVRLARECKRCGLRHVEDTWGQDPLDGEQGLTSHTYDTP